MFQDCVYLTFSVFGLGNLCRRWMNSLQRPSNKLTLLTWWRMSTSTFESWFANSIFFFPPPEEQHWLLSQFPLCVCLTLLFLPVNERRVVRNPNYGWRALRLLSRRSPHFFQPTNQKFKSLADYLDSMVSKLAKELPVRKRETLWIATKMIHGGREAAESWSYFWFHTCRRTSLLRRSRQERRMTMIMEIIF